MKTLLLIGLLSISTNGQADTSKGYSDCEIVLYQKTSGAKTVYTLDGDSISLKVREKLSSQCKFTIKAMSATQKRTMTIKSLQKRLKKLGVK